MKYKKIVHLSKKEQFIKELESMIITGVLPIGSKIPSERELAETMGLSKTVVNSGILEMANKGFLIVKPRQGTYVQDYKRYGKLDALLSIMTNNYGNISTQDMKSFLEMRLVVERLALQLAIPKLTDDMLVHLNDLYQQVELSIDDTQACLANFNLHHEICFLSENVICPLLLSSFKVPILNVWENYCEKHGRSQMVENAQNLMTHIQKKDIDGAIETLEQIINCALLEL